MLFNDVTFKLGNVKILFHILQRLACVGKTVETFALWRNVGVPVVKEEVVKKTCPCTCTLIQGEKFTQLIIIV